MKCSNNTENIYIIQIVVEFALNVRINSIDGRRCTTEPEGTHMFTGFQPVVWGYFNTQPDLGIFEKSRRRTYFENRQYRCFGQTNTFAFIKGSFSMTPQSEKFYIG